MKDLLLTLLHLAVVTAKLCGPGGVRAVIAENLVIKQQLIVLRRTRRRAPSLTLRDRLLCGFASLFLRAGRIRKVAIAIRPSTLLAFHQALVRRKIPPAVLVNLTPEEARTERAGRCPHPSHCRAQVAQSSVRLSTDRVDHFADIWDRPRQERRAPRPDETLSPGSRQNRTLVVGVHRTHGKQPLERRPLSL
ncbi:MAG: hypothetical protein ABJA98_11760 [Acidobacteriota bacterium]